MCISSLARLDALINWDKQRSSKGTGSLFRILEVLEIYYRDIWGDAGSLSALGWPVKARYTLVQDCHWGISTTHWEPTLTFKVWWIFEAMHRQTLLPAPALSSEIQPLCLARILHDPFKPTACFLSLVMQCLLWSQHPDSHIGSCYPLLPPVLPLGTWSFSSTSSCAISAISRGSLLQEAFLGSSPSVCLLSIIKQ